MARLIFHKTCDWAPEQYDAYIGRGGHKVGYIRLRGGHFAVRMPDVGGDIVFEEDLPNKIGSFDSEAERDLYLTIAAAIILRRLKLNINKNPYVVVTEKP